MGVSGVPQVQDSVDFGFTDFSEFSVAAGLPAGITGFGICAGEFPSTVAIANDPAEGNYFSMSGHNLQSWGFGLDAFDALISYGELLARVWTNIDTANRRGIGPAMNLSGLIGQPCVSPDFDGEGGGTFFRAGPSDFEIAGVQNNDGSGSVPVNSVNLNEPWQNEEWAWMRIRIEDAGGGMNGWSVKLWYGNIEDEQATFDGTAVSGRVITGAVPGALGWMMTQFSDIGEEQRISYLSFTSDRTKISAPTPGPLTPAAVDFPKPIIANPEFEYDARLLRTFGDGYDLVDWVDSSPGGVSAATENPPPDAHPAVRLDRWEEGIPSVEFRDLNAFPPDSLEAMDYPAGGWELTDFTCFVCAQVIDITEGAAFVGNRFGATPPREAGIGVQEDGSVFFGFGDEFPGGPDIQTNLISAADLVKAGDKIILTCRHTDGASGQSPEGMLIRLNGKQIASNTGLLVDVVATIQQGSLGEVKRTGSGVAFRGVDRLIGFIAGYSIAATEGEILAMEGFLNEVWNVNPPLRIPTAVAPTSVSQLWIAGALRDKSPSGLIQTRPTKAAGWMFKMSYPLLQVRNAVHQELTTFMTKAWNRGSIFLAKHPMQPGSGRPPNGLGTSTVVINGAQLLGAVSILTNGWPVSISNVARAGDVIKIEGDDGVYLITESASSDSTGAAELFITPPLTAGPADLATVKTTDVEFRVVIAEKAQLEPSRLPESLRGPTVTLLEALT